MAANLGNPNRQKMINLMYIVLIALLALNVSSEVLDGFAKVEQSLKLSIASTEAQNTTLKGEMLQIYQNNPIKVGPWFNKSVELSQKTDSLYRYIQFLKEAIAQATDGDDADVNQLKKSDYLGASEEVMLNPITHRGAKLKNDLKVYSSVIDSLLPNGESKNLLMALFATSDNQNDEFRLWEERTFEGMPSASAITLLTKMQADLRYTEGYIYTELIKSVDEGEIRVNKLSALVVPESKIVLRGSPYQAQIILSSIDSTQTPSVYVNGTSLSPEKKGFYSIRTNKVGTFPVKGYIEAKTPTGEVQRTSFESEYCVIEPMFSVAPTMMNVLYAGIQNELKITVPGVEMNRVSASLVGSGSLQRKGNFWLVKPTKVGEHVKISVYAQMASGGKSLMGQSELRVRALPDPSPFLELKLKGSATKRFKGGQISKQQILSAGGVKAAIDDSLVDFAYEVLRFQLISFDSMGNALPENSVGWKFSSRQIQKIKSARRGKRLFITNIIARGADGIERQIPALDLTIK